MVKEREKVITLQKVLLQGIPDGLGVEPTKFGGDIQGWDVAGVRTRNLYPSGGSIYFGMQQQLRQE